MKMLLSVGEPIVATELVQRAGAAGPLERGPHASGAPAIFSYVAAGLGTATAFVGGVGADAQGEFSRREFARGGADPAAVHVDHAAPTATVLIHYDLAGERRFEFQLTGSAAAALPAAALGSYPERASWFHCSGSALLVTGRLGATTLEAARRAKAAGARVSLDPNIREELMTPAGLDRLRAMLDLADAVFPSEGELEALGTAPDPLLERGCLVVETMAAAGARARLGKAVWTEAALADPAAVVDTDGAGDTFAGAFVAGLIAGLEPPACLRAASRVVALAIAVEGPTTVDLSTQTWRTLTT
jgi:sugar/nucleoside kinase (ribokinase family)